MTASHDGTQAIKDCGAQNSPHIVRLPGQELIDEVVDNEPVAARERRDEGVDIRRVGHSAQRQRDQL